MSRADNIRKSNDGRGPPRPCSRGCAEFAPVACEALDPFTVRMVVRCPRCGRSEESIGDLRGLVDETRTAEDFARDFVNAPPLARGSR